MASLSFRDRFYSGSVAHAVTSPSAIIALGVGAAAGLVLAPVGIPMGILGAVLGGAIGYGGRVALALPRKDKGPHIDPFSVEDPWRTAIVNALRAQARFTESLRTLKAGPLRDHLTSIGSQVDDAVQQCWRVAQQGQVVARARAGISDTAARRDLQRIQGQVPMGGQPSDTQRETMASLQAQIDTGARMDKLISDTHDRLDLLDARLDQSVTQAIELSVSDESADLQPLGNDLSKIIDDLSSLRVAMESVDHADPGEAVELSDIASSPAPPMSASADADTPPPLPPTAGRS